MEPLEIAKGCGAARRDVATKRPESTAVTDSERVSLGVRTLEQARARVVEMNSGN